MKKYKKLVRELRDTAELFDEIDAGRGMLLDAANAIEYLNEKLENYEDPDNQTDKDCANCVCFKCLHKSECCEDCEDCEGTLLGCEEYDGGSTE